MVSKETKTALLGLGTAFVSTATGLVAAGLYWQAAALGAVGLAAFYLREILKETPAK